MRSPCFNWASVVSLEYLQWYLLNILICDRLRVVCLHFRQSFAQSVWLRFLAASECRDSSGSRELYTGFEGRKFGEFPELGSSGVVASTPFYF
ncbi:hypothetical protein C5167_039972 [Papaver somniferum]|uniref:Uncharacterized protein n=1 Tax=Papaver somniferum TaxID=3469 RepID=A0A4Y7IHU6_PAPSO|nr:hypothetical protein C5167_039972 [Papaver somniferum]